MVASSLLKHFLLAADAEDAARQAAIMVLQQDGGLRIGDEVRVSRI